MGIADNLFTRKGEHSRKSGGGRGQQHRLDFGSQRLSKEERHLVAPQRCVIDENGRIASSYVGSESARNGGKGSSSMNPKCICYRDSCVLTCANFRCTWTGVGRVRRLCTLHPSVTFLLDLPQCPLCLCGLREVPDRPIPKAK